MRLGKVQRVAKGDNGHYDRSVRHFAEKDGYNSRDQQYKDKRIHEET
jgi:hypothetical protein